MASTSGLGVSPRVTLSNVAASTPPACAAPRRPARQSEKLLAPAPVAARRAKLTARPPESRRMAKASILGKAFTFLRSRRFPPRIHHAVARRAAIGKRRLVPPLGATLAKSWLRRQACAE